MASAVINWTLAVTESINKNTLNHEAHRWEESWKINLLVLWMHPSRIMNYLFTQMLKGNPRMCKQTNKQKLVLLPLPKKSLCVVVHTYNPSCQLLREQRQEYEEFETSLIIKSAEDVAQL